jgi:hypothetical protein
MENLNYNIEKEVRGEIIDFRITVEQSEVRNKFEMKIKYSINNGKEFFAQGINEEHKAIVFYEQELIAGKKSTGFIIPSEIFNEIVAFEKQVKQNNVDRTNKEIQDIIDGNVKIKASYHDGEYLSGYQVWGHAAKLLGDLKLVKRISGWGYLINDDVIKEIGEEFTYAQAAEFAQPKLDAIAKEKAEREAAIQAKFKEVKETGKPVILFSYSEECNDPKEDCDVDNIIEYAMPDGTVKTERHHTW